MSGARGGFPARGVAERLLALEAAVAELRAQGRASVGSGKTAAEAKRQAAGGAAPAPADPDGAAGGEKAVSEGEPSGPERLAGMLGSARLAAALVRAGYTSPEAVASAPDEALLAVDGVAEKALKLIREKVTP
jgi:hypothetical protein